MHIKNDTRENGLPIWCKLLLFFVLLVDFNSDFRLLKLPIVGFNLHRLLQVGFVGCVFLYCFLKKNSGHQSPYFRWCIVFLFYTFISIVWAINQDVVTTHMRVLLYTVAMVAALSYMVRSEKAIEDVMQCIVWASFFLGIYILRVIGLENLGGEQRIGGTMEGLENWNSNDIGMKMSMAFTLCIYLIHRSRNAGRIFYILIAAVSLLPTFFSGSRKAIIMVALGLFLYMYIQSHGVKKMRAVLIGIAILVGMYTAIMTIEPLYNVIGVRIQNMLDGMFGEGTSEISFRDRQMMITNGMRYFWERPIFGHGLANYAILFGRDTGWEVYSHNNFIEMLVNGGIVGFVIFYFIYAFLIIKLWKPAFKDKNKLATILLIVNVVLLVLHRAFIAYNTTYAHLAIMLACMYPVVHKKGTDSE